MNTPFEIPILFILFNRPDTTMIVFEQIRRLNPKYLFVAADGPRPEKPEDIEKCDEARGVVKKIDWDCELKTLFREENVGCGRGPSEAISWFFEHVEMGIILEDDCVPSLSFFTYCEYLLKKYQNNNNVWIISGRSHASKSKTFENYDYIFSNYPHTWGWATWKRSWNYFDIQLSNEWSNFYKSGGFKNVFFTRIQGIFWNSYYARLNRDPNLSAHVWDYQFNFHMNLNRGLAIIPAENLVENIGYEGTHFGGITKILKLKAQQNFTIKKEPSHILPIREYEIYFFRRFFGEKLFLFAVNKFKKFLKL